MSLLIFSAISFELKGFTYKEAFWQTSLTEGISETTVGVPHAIASNGGMPKPSYREGYTKHKACI